MGQGSMRTIRSGVDCGKLESTIARGTKGGSNYPASMEESWIITTSNFSEKREIWVLCNIFQHCT